MRIPMFALALTFFVTGCDNARNLNEICKENDEICSEFDGDNWCKVERNALSIARIDLKEKEHEFFQYKLLTAYEDYIKCMGLASQIQHIKLKGKTTLRMNYLLTATAQLSDLDTRTSNSKHPHLLYYHWSRNGKKNALEAFLALEGSDLVENSTAQYHLATYYIKRDTEKAIMLLFRSLELHEQGAQIQPEIFESLATIFTNKEKYQQAYIWLRIYQLTQESKKTNHIIERNLASYQSNYHLDGHFLDSVAKNTLRKIKTGAFKSPKF